MRVNGKSERTASVSFSGIDGAGKSTQIEALRIAAEQAGKRVRVIRFWDEVARLTRLRETSGHRIFKGDKGIGSPERPIHRRDKNVRAWPMTAMRWLLYFLDALSARRVAKRELRSGIDLVIFDRYVYDELANLTLSSRVMRFYARFIMSFVPRPGISFVLDADPAEARARKPEYPLDFLIVNRKSYLELSELIGGMTVVPSMAAADVTREVLGHAFDRLSLETAAPKAPESHAREDQLSRKFLRSLWLLPPLVFSSGGSAFAASCTTQAQMQQAWRDSIGNSARVILTEVQRGNVTWLRSNTFPAVAADFAGIERTTQYLQPLIQRATITIEEIYQLDALTDPASAQRTDFYCGSPVVGFTFNGLPPGLYAVAIMHATGVSQPHQVSLVLAKSPDNRWLLAGFFARPMVLAGHDGLWYWREARQYAQQKGDWGAFFYYRIATYLLDPVDFLASANLEKLRREGDQIRPVLPAANSPLSVNAKNAVFRVTSVDTTTALGALDFDVHYAPDAAQITDLRNPALARQQVTDLMEALLQSHPELRNAFHGVWLHADQGNASLFALELPMGGGGAFTPPAADGNPASRQ